MKKGNIFFISFIVLSVLVIATTYSISYIKKQNHIEMGEKYLKDLTELNVVYRSFPNLEKYDSAFWFQDQYKNDYELDIETLAFQKYRYAGTEQPNLIASVGDNKENALSTAKGINPDFFTKQYDINIETLGEEQITEGYTKEEIVYITQTGNGDLAQTFEFTILDDMIYQILLYNNN